MHGKRLVESNAFDEKESIPSDKQEENILFEKPKEIFYKFVQKDGKNRKI